jgi:hypothetical protein
MHLVATRIPEIREVVTSQAYNVYVDAADVQGQLMLQNALRSALGQSRGQMAEELVSQAMAFTIASGPDPTDPAREHYLVTLDPQRALNRSTLREANVVGAVAHELLHVWHRQHHPEVTGEAEEVAVSRKTIDVIKALMADATLRAQEPLLARQLGEYLQVKERELAVHERLIQDPTYHSLHGAATTDAAKREVPPEIERLYREMMARHTRLPVRLDEPAPTGPWGTASAEMERSRSCLRTSSPRAWLMAAPRMLATAFMK